MGTLQKFFHLFLPNHMPDPEDPDYEIHLKQHNRAIAMWRQWMGYSQIALWLFFWWTLGLGSALGVQVLGNGFARAESVSRVEKRQLEQIIQADHDRYCKAKPGTEAKHIYWENLQAHQEEYEAITGKEYKLPPCSEIAGVME